MIYRLRFSMLLYSTMNLNGGGYPCCLKGDQIQQMSMLCAIADVYDRLTTPGPARRVVCLRRPLALIFQGGMRAISKRIGGAFYQAYGYISGG